MSNLAYSFDGENYTGEYDTIEEIIKDLMEYPSFINGRGFTTVHIGKRKPYSDCGSNAYDTIIEYFQESAYELGGDYAEYYLEGINPEHEKFLEDKLDSIWEEFKKLTRQEEPFFIVPNSTEYKIYTDGRYEVLEDRY